MARKEPPKKNPPPSQLPDLEAGWSDVPAKPEPLPAAPAGDFDFPELDEVLAETPPGEDTGTDLPKAVAREPERSDTPEPPAEPVAAGDLDLPDWVQPSPAAGEMDEAPPRSSGHAEGGSVLDDRASFAAEAQRLARAREWQSVAALTSAALDHSPWAAQAETRIALLTALARLYRDRLRDLPSAEDQFRRLLELAPADPEPNRFLAQRYRERGDWRALYDLRVAAVDATWDPEQRLEWTRDAARIATEQLRAEDLAIAAWERLWKSGDAQQEATRALSESYRRAGQWDRLAEFLVRRADELSGADRVVVLREAAEAYLTGDRNHDRATEVLQRILKESPDDPVSLLVLARVHARRNDWAHLAELGMRRVDRTREGAFLDVRRLAADALWTAGDQERSVQVYDRVLAIQPRDPDALKAKEEYLARRGDVDGLVSLLDARAQGTDDAAERATLLERAADLAARELNDLRRAAALLERRAQLEAGRVQALDRLAEIYETLGEHDSVRRVLEELLRLVRNPRERIELLRRLGDHCAHRLGDDERAEKCWREILDAVPDDRGVREELIALYRRRGDFEAVDRSWSAYAWRALDEGSLATIWRAAAVNIQENVSDAARTLRAWQRVLDLSPNDETALVAVVTQLRALDDRHLLIDALEARSRIAAPAEQLEIWSEMARLYEQANEPAAALATYERMLGADPTHAAALEACARLYGAEQAGVTRGTLEIAAANSDGDAKSTMIRKLLALVPPGEGLERFFTLRRLLSLSGPNPALLSELATAATEANAHAALAALYEEAAADSADAATRAAHHQRLAALYEGKLDDPLRALLTLSSARQRVPVTMDELAPILKLAAATQRHEDAFALYGVAASVEAPLELRRAALRQRQALAEQKLNDPARAFHQAAWLVRLDAEDRQALADAERLAGIAKLWRDLDGLYAELWDRARAGNERLELLRKRRDLRGNQLGDELGALDLTLVLYRLSPTAELQEELCRRAEKLSAWARVLPAIEGRVRQRAVTAAELSWLAATHEDKRKDARHAFELFGLAFLADSSSSEIEGKLRGLATATKQLPRFGQRLREAAATASDPMRALGLYGQAAALYANEVGRRDLAVDVHRRILQLNSRAFDSYEVAFAQLREAGMWRELRDLLEQRVEVDEQGDDKGQLLRRLEIARISREELRDGEAALRAYAAILERQPDNADALAGVGALTNGPMDPKLELERLRLELNRAVGARRVEILLACSELQQRELDDVPGALASLKQLVSESGAGGAGYAPLYALYEKSGNFADAVGLMEARAAVIADGKERIELLRGAIAAAETHRLPAERVEQLNQRLLALAPDDRRARTRLLHFHRLAARHAELEALIADTIARLPAEAPAEERKLLVAERLRLMDRALGRHADAEALARAELARTPNDEELLLWLASQQRRLGNHAAWSTARQQQARLLPPRLGALVLCHLAESAQETSKGTEEALACYRAARTLDPDNKFAAEGLKALGRRTKNWRATASLLSDADAQELSFEERAARLVDRGRGEEAKAPAAAVELYERALAIDPDTVAAWDALGRLRGKLGDAKGRQAAARAALLATWRGSAPAAQQLTDEGKRFDELAELARHNDDPAAGLYAERAHQIDRTLPASALLVSQRAETESRKGDAVAILSALLDGRTALSPAQKLDANFRLGLLMTKDAAPDRALAHFRDGLRIEPLHPGLLRAVADVLMHKNRVAAAIQHYTQALLLAQEPRRRAQLYARLGMLWDEQLRSPDEAGACYDLAVSHGLDDAEIMMRALGYYRRMGRQEEAGRMVDRLLPRATTPAALAALWTERGSLLAAADDPRAVEAFDMALSYDPSHRAAVDGLAELLERRGEWQQLIDLLEARLDGGAPDERAQCLRRLARIARNQQHDAAAAESFLRRALALQPRVEDFDELCAIIGDAPARQDEREQLMADRLAVAGPFVPAIVQTGIRLAATGERRQAWCLFSPLMTTIIHDAALKSLVLEVRKEFEKAETLPLLTPTLHRELLPAELAPLVDVLAELDGVMGFGPAGAEGLGGGRLSRVDGKTALAKSFGAIAERLGLPQAILTRAEELPVAYRILDPNGPNADEPPHVVARADLFSQLSPCETNAVLALMLELGRPGVRVLASLPAAEAQRVTEALFAAVDDAGVSEELAPLVEKIAAAAGKERLARWAKQLGAVDRKTDVPALLVETARKVALIAAGELRFAVKLVSRLDEPAAKLPSTGSIEELEAFFAELPAARRMLAFAASPGFARFMKA